MAAAFADRVLAWWDKNGRKDLPWQQNRNPYRVWVAEIMLQQTQVSTVIPYFERFMSRYPELADLAGANLDEVMSTWSGLGYYARCRNLHKSAVTCMEKHQARIPDTAAELEALPGIGRSTAAAIISQAHNEPRAILDGNVKRLVARHAAIEGWPGQSRVLNDLWAEAEQRLPRNRGADYTQAVMDLGATLCTARTPNCDSCPVSEDCIALKKDLVNEIPGRKPAKKIPERSTNMLIARNGVGQILLERRPPTGIWGGLWCFPEYKQLEQVMDQLNLELKHQYQLPTFLHRFTHFQLTITPLLADCAQAAKAVESPASHRWYTLEEALTLGIPKPVRTTLESIGNITG